MLALALAAVLVSVPARGAVRTEVLGPIRLSGVQRPMSGPKAEREITFERAGWIRRVSLRLLDARRAPLPDERLLCHAGFAPPAAQRALKPTLIVNEGLRESSFPEGYGLRVERGDSYLLDAMLQSRSAETDGDYYAEFSIELAEPGVELKPLAKFHHYLSPQGSPAARRISPMAWWVPPGRHEYAQVVSFPVDARIRFIAIHLHRFAKSVRLEDLGAGKVLFEGNTVQDAEGQLLRTPTLTSAEGIPVRREGRYRWSVVYDNPLEERALAMATFHMYHEGTGVSGLKREASPR